MKIAIPSQVLFIIAPPYIGDSKRAPNLEERRLWDDTHDSQGQGLQEAGMPCLDPTNNCVAEKILKNGSNMKQEWLKLLRFW